jgi:hypothetical protein
MNGLGKMAVCLAGGLMLNISVRANDAIASGNPFGPIVTRNVFGLNPLPTNAPVSTEDNTPLKITPNGIMSIFGQLQVLFKVAPRAGQPGAKEESFVLSEGQSQDEIEVVHINEKAGMVTFNNHGTVQEIPLANAPALNMPVPAPGQNIPPPGAIPTPFGGRFGGGPGAPSSPGVPGVRFGGNNSSPGNAPAFSAAPTRGNSGYPGQVMMQQNSVAGSSATQPQNTRNTLTADQQKAMIEVMRAKYQSEGNPMSQIMPP